MHRAKAVALQVLPVAAEGAEENGKEEKEEEEVVAVRVESLVRGENGDLVPVEGKTADLKVVGGQGVRSSDLFKATGLRSYDPGYMNTIAGTSKITFIDGAAGVLRYRGYPIEELAERSTFLEVAFLLMFGDLPNKTQLDDWQSRVMAHSFPHGDLVNFLSCFRYDAHPMGVLVSSVAAMGTFYPEANASLAGMDVFESESIRNKQVYRIIGKLPSIAACAYRNRIGRPFNFPQAELGYVENFLYMLDCLNPGSDFTPHPVLVKALDVLFILHADHEFNCSTSAMRHITSSLADPYTAIAGAAGALYGPLHGGANEAVLRMLEDIGSVENIDQFLEDVRNKKKKLMGFGHRVYKSYDPRAKIIRKVAYEVFDVCGKEPLIDLATALEKRALEDPYFLERNLFPNVDFYTGVIYKAMGFPTDMFPVLFCIPRAVGWLAHWIEQLDDPENKIVRPRQLYTGPETREYEALLNRPAANHYPRAVYHSQYNRRHEVSANQDRKR
jgi:citrate synthase